MRRETIKPRDGWQKRLEDAGCYYHHVDGKPYWREDAVYVFTQAEIDRIEEAADTLHEMCVEHCAQVVQRGDYEGYGFPDEVKQLVEQSFRAKEPSLYGRFDLGYDGKDLKLYEYNADTPTALPEAAVWQWQALEDRGWPDQFNSIHESILSEWGDILNNSPVKRMHFAAMKDGQHEDWGNVHYLLETAAQEGFDTTSINIEEIGWNGQTFTDINERPIEMLFKLYPWEWLMADEFGWRVRQSQTRFLEPAWKMLLSTKALLPLLWKAHPNQPLLLEAHFESEVWGNANRALLAAGDWLRKPLLGREGANITRTSLGMDRWAANNAAHYDPKYDKHGYVVQRYFEPTTFTVDRGFRDRGGDPVGPLVTPVLGVWVVGHKACGLGIREDASAITTNASCFVPHFFTE